MIKDEACDRLLTGLDFNLLFGCYVYAWCRGDKFLYVGATNKGLARLFTHGVVGRVEPILETDKIKMWKCDPKDLSRVEREFIIATTPKYNRQYVIPIEYSPRKLKVANCVVCGQPFPSSVLRSRKCYGCRPIVCS